MNRLRPHATLTAYGRIAPPADEDSNLMAHVLEGVLVPPTNYTPVFLLFVRGVAESRLNPRLETHMRRAICF